MSTDIVGSNFPDSVAAQLAPSSKNHFRNSGQNGYDGPSSLTPGQTTASPSILPDQGKPIMSDQTRTLKGSPVPTTFGMKKPGK